LGEQDADLTPDGRVVLSGTDKLAGSALRMNDAIANVMRMAGIALADAVRMVTLNPARTIGLEGHMRGLQTGERGDVVTFRVANGAIAIQDVFLAGKSVVP
jgi:N-acetylglucosamine-6-phosphate deacetylase